MRSRMAQNAFYANVLPALFRSAHPPETGARVLIKKLSEGADAGGKYFYRFAPCAPNDRVEVTPWWSFDGRRVAICRDDYRPGVQTAEFNGEGEYCEGISSQYMPSIRCGCGERLINCAPPAIASKLSQAAADEPSRTVQAIVQQHRAFSEVLTANATARSDWGNYFLLEHGLSRFIYIVAPQNFDTHIFNDTDQSANSAYLFTAISVLLDRLKTVRGPDGQPLDESVGLLMASELGRHPYLNHFAGKDHFPEVPVFWIGPGLRPGVYGHTNDVMLSQPISPRTGRLASDADAYVPDLDDIGATVLDWFGYDPISVGYSGRRLGFLLKDQK